MRCYPESLRGFWFWALIMELPAIYVILSAFAGCTPVPASPKGVIVHGPMPTVEKIVERPVVVEKIIEVPAKPADPLAVPLPGVKPIEHKAGPAAIQAADDPPANDTPRRGLFRRLRRGGGRGA